MKTGSETTNWYGIRVVFCVMCMLVAMAGFGMFCFGVVFKPLIAAFNWDRGAVAIANSVYLLAGGIGGIIANKLLKKYRIKTVMIIGAVSGALSYFLLSYTTSLLQLYVLYFIGGISIGGLAGFIPGAKAVADAFPDNRGTAMAFATAGTSVASIATVPFITKIVTDYGWQTGFRVMAAAILLVDFLLPLFLIRKGDVPVRNDRKNPETLKQEKSYMKNPAFWMIIASFSLVGIAFHGILANEVPYLTDTGITPMTAAGIVGMTGLIGYPGNLLHGYLSEKTDMKYVLFSYAAIQSIGAVLLLFVHDESLAWISTLTVGFGLGATVGVLPTSVRTICSHKDFPEAYGRANLVYLVASMFGGPLAGYFYDMQGTYFSAFAIFAAMYMIAAVLGLFTWHRNTYQELKMSE